MLKIWIVLYIAGKISAVWGPVNQYTYNECKLTSVSINGMLVSGSSIKLDCIESATTPVINTSIANR